MPNGNEELGLGTKIRGYVKPRHIPLRPHIVVLHDSPHHTFQYVIEMLQKVCKLSKQDAEKAAKEVHDTGHVVVFQGGKELCELKQEQITSCGKDPLSPQCKGPMSATVEEQP